MAEVVAVARARRGAARGAALAGPTASDVDVAAKLYRGLGDPTRLRIVLGLLSGERRVVDLVADLGLAHDVRDLLTSTERLLERTGVEVALCPANP